VKGHKKITQFCAMVGEYKAKLIEEGIVVRPSRFTVAVNDSGVTSISQAGRGGSRDPSSSARLPTILECEDTKHSLEVKEKALIFLPVRTRPDLTTPTMLSSR
jgi:hypothetical protein